jgi:hypothetical protein
MILSIIFDNYKTRFAFIAAIIVQQCLSNMENYFDEILINLITEKLMAENNI